MGMSVSAIGAGINLAKIQILNYQFSILDSYMVAAVLWIPFCKQYIYVRVSHFRCYSSGETMAPSGMQILNNRVLSATAL